MNGRKSKRRKRGGRKWRTRIIEAKRKAIRRNEDGQV
jgi:hypothetical protein